MALFFRQIMDGASALNAVSDEIGPTDLANINELTYYIVFSAGVSAGAVQPETSHRSALGPPPTFTGTWSPEGSPVTFASNAVKHVQITGVTHWRRLRISTAIADGTVSIFAMGR